jgi:effector-binding domain-containing protein
VLVNRDVEGIPRRLIDSAIGGDVATAGDRLDNDQIGGPVGTLVSRRDHARLQMRFNKILPLVLLGLLALPAGGATAASAQTLGTDVKVTSVKLSAQPMVYVTATISMAEIPAFMGTAFTTLDQFLGTSGVAALGPPMAVYHDWSDDKTAVDVGFPVSSADAAKAGGGVLAGMTPDGYALKVVHIGPYEEFPAIYAAIGAAMKAAGIPDSPRMWEVYLSEPGVTPAAELVTEIYSQVAAEDAAKFPAE